MADSNRLGKVLPEINITVDDDEELNSDESLEAGEIFDPHNGAGEIFDPHNGAGEIFDPHNGAAGEEFSKREIIRKWIDTLEEPENSYPNRDGGFETGVNLAAAVLGKKLVARAVRFGLKEEECKQITQKEIDDMYKSFGMDPENLESNKHIRLEVIHMRGVTDMNTNQVIDYFKDYGPKCVEWINDLSCNVIWHDKTSAARAMIGLSQPQPLAVKEKNKKEELKDSFDVLGLPKDNSQKDSVIEMIDLENKELFEDQIKDHLDDIHSTNLSDVKDTESKTDSAMDIEDVDDNFNNSNEEDKNVVLGIPIPPGVWRIGIPSPKAKTILLRFATKDDKKVRGAEKRSQYYQKYGNPNYGGMRGLISTSRKRKFHASRNHNVIEKFSASYDQKYSADTYSSPEFQRRSKVPRMKMYADEEEEKRKQRNFHSLKCTQNFSSVKNRLGSRYTRDDLQQIGPRYSSDDETDDDSPTLSVTCKIPSRYNIWTDQAKAMAEEELQTEPEIESERKQWKREKFQRSSSRYSAYGSERAQHESRRHNFDQYSGDLRDALNLASRKRSEKSSKDLRSRIERLRKDNPNKHRSPLLKDKE